MEKFLQLVAKDLFSLYGEKIHEVTIVFPNRRAGVFFQKFLSEVTNKVIWAPNFITINDLMKELSGLNTGDRISLVLELYKVYKKVLQTSETFDSFYYWGEMLINDFDDIDKYLVNVADLFQNIAAEKEIEVTFDTLDDEQKKIIEQFLTNIRASRDSKQKQDFVAFWKLLFPIYTAYTEILHKNGLVYEGKIYRNVAELIIKNDTINLKKHKHFAFVGFNVLNKCEETLFDHLKKINKATFYWDYDNWYLNNNLHEAQFFIHPNLQKYPNALPGELFNNISKEKKIQLISVSSKIAQVKILPDIIENKIKDNSNDTAIVLADESLLINLLNSIPDAVEGINVTMGFPVKHSQVVSLINKLFYLKKNARSSKDGLVFRGKDVQNLTSHYLVKSYAKQETLQVQQLILKEKHFALKAEFFKTFEKLKKIIEIFNNGNLGFIASVNKTLKIILHDLTKEKNTALQLEKELIYHIVKETNKVIDILDKELSSLSIEVQNKIINQVISNQTVSFVGEPIADLQIMGILESRALDFENLIILSMNEGIIPKISASGSFIPYSLREGFGLQTIRHQDSVFSYYFFRLIQRAKQVFLIYNASTDGLSSGEPSRYVQQIKYDTTFETKELTYGFEIDFPGKSSITIQKTIEIQEKLQTYFNPTLNKYFSPSALNDYIDCSLRFYFKYIQELKPVEEIDDTMQAMHFGNILHHTLQEIYAPYLYQIVDKEIIKAIQKAVNIKQLVEKNYAREFNVKQNIDMLPGENAVLLDVIFNDIIQILDYDAAKAPFILQSLEDKYEKICSLNNSRSNQNFKVGGKIDRIDENAGVLEIIDYKTSKPDLSIKSIEELFDSSMKKRKKEVFQLMFYAYLVNEKEKSKKLSPQLYITRKIGASADKNDMVISFDKIPLKVISQELIDAFEQNLIKLFVELFNNEIPFTQTEFEEKCNYCDFKDICQREAKDF